MPPHSHIHVVFLNRQSPKAILCRLMRAGLTLSHEGGVRYRKSRIFGQAGWVLVDERDFGIDRFLGWRLKYSPIGIRLMYGPDAGCDYDIRENRMTISPSLNVAYLTKIPGVVDFSFYLRPLKDFLEETPFENMECVADL